MGRDVDDGFSDFLMDIVNGADLRKPAMGITKKVISDGIDSLSEKQKYIFQSEVMDQYFIEANCEQCCSNIPFSEMFEANDNGGLCGYCVHKNEKMLDE